MTMTYKTTLLLIALALVTSGAALPTRATVAGNQPALEVQDLQGKWEGVIVGQEAGGKFTITFKGNSLHFQGLKPDEWYDATFTLKEGVLPQQMVATITGCELARDLGKVIEAVFKIDDGTLFLAGLDTDGEEQVNVFGDGSGAFKIGDGAPNVCGPGSPNEPSGFTGKRQFSYKFQKIQTPAGKVEGPKPQ